VLFAEYNENVQVKVDETGRACDTHEGVVNVAFQ
jgi:hypothetical protein